MNHISHQPTLLGSLLVLFLYFVGFTQQAAAQCVPAPDPDLNNDGIVSLADFYIVTSNFGVPGADETADTNCDGNVDTTDVLFVQSSMGQTFPVGATVDVEIQTSPNDVTAQPGDLTNIATSVNFTSSSNNTPFTLDVSQVVNPSTGITLTPTVDGSSFYPSADFATSLNQEISATAVGTYEITTSVTIAETGQMSTSVALINVVSGQEPSLVVNEPGSDPSALVANTTTDVLFTVQVQGDDADDVTKLGT